VRGHDGVQTQKQLTVAEKFKLLDRCYYEQLNVSAHALADNVVDIFISYTYTL